LNWQARRYHLRLLSNDAKKLDVLKVDTEGFVFEVLKGATYNDYVVPDGELFLVSNALYALPPMTD
jgi:hypothetical protein